MGSANANPSYGFPLGTSLKPVFLSPQNLQRQSHQTSIIAYLYPRQHYRHLTRSRPCPLLSLEYAFRLLAADRPMTQYPSLL